MKCAIAWILKIRNDENARLKKSRYSGLPNKPLSLIENYKKQLKLIIDNQINKG
jgi:hypothetical protein